MSMEYQAAAREMRDILAPHLDEYSLELLDVAIANEEWKSACGMAAQAAEYYSVKLPDELVSLSK